VETFAAGQVVLFPFPFSNLAESKYRPAVLLADAGRGDWIACQITSNPYADAHAIEMRQSNFVLGGLQRVSYARPGKLFTANETLFVNVAGKIDAYTLNSVRKKVISLLQEEVSP